MTTGNVGHEMPGGGPQRCPQCGNLHFEEGFVDDTDETASGVARWIAGPPERGRFGGVKRAGKRRHPIIAFRCTVCHHLSLYVGPG